MQDIIDELKGIATQYDGVLRIKYYGGKGLSSVTLILSNASIKIKHTTPEGLESCALEVLNRAKIALGEN